MGCTASRESGTKCLGPGLADAFCARRAGGERRSATIESMFAAGNERVCMRDCTVACSGARATNVQPACKQVNLKRKNGGGGVGVGAGREGGRTVYCFDTCGEHDNGRQLQLMRRRIRFMLQRKRD
jgi:hypothetical protein